MLHLLILLIVLGLVAWGVSKWVTIPPKFKKLIYFVLLACGIIAVCADFGVLDYLDRPVPRIHR